MSNPDREQYREFISKLQIEENRLAALNDIKNFLLYKPAVDAVSTIKSEGISKIFSCLNVPDKTYIDLTCEVLKVCFEKFEVGEVIRNYTSHIMYLLRHEKDCVRRLAIDEVHKAVAVGTVALPVPQHIDVFVATAQLVTDQDVGIANKAILITSNLGFEAYPKILEEMKIAFDYSNSSKCNAYEVVINISLKSVELLKLCADHGYFDNMLTDLQSDDVLYQMNILELLSRLAEKQHGIGYLMRHGALQKISESISELKSNPLSGLLTPGYMKFFGSIAHHYPRELFEKYPVVVDMLFETFDSNDNTVLPVALDTLGFIGSTIEGKLSLAALGSRYTQTVEKVANMIRNSPTEIKIRALHCFASLIGFENDPKVTKSAPIDHRVTLMTREWFRTLSTRPPCMEAMYDMCKNPFPDIRLAAFTLLDAVCQHQWGEELVARTAGFIEYLLDRSTDHTKEAKEAKYDIIKRLSNSAAFDTNMVGRLQKFVEQGPFFSETTLEVAMEEGD